MLYLMSLILSISFTYFLIKYPLVVAEPSQRGMHSTPKATSGGIGIALSILIFSILMEISLIFVILLILISLVGLLDDKYNISKSVRLVSQLIIPVALLILQPLEITTYSLLFYIVVIISIVYMINAFNFMDGIDLIVSNQTIFILLSLYLLSINMIEVNPEIKNIILISLFSIIGFSVFNFSPSKIFLGNIGSYLLGFIIMYIYYHLINYNLAYIYSLITLTSVFIIETVFILFKRFYLSLMAKKQDKNISIVRNLIMSASYVMEAHCSHNYQIISKKLKSHTKVNVIILIYNLLWCLPLSYVVLKVPDYSLILVIICFMPYTFWCYYNQNKVNK